jgi:dCTP deaminase
MILAGSELERALAESDCEPGGIGADLHVPERTVVPADGFAVVDAGERLELPTYAAATITGRSAHMRRGLTMPGGVVDPGYEGRLTLEFFNHSDEPYVLEGGEAGGRLTLFRLSQPVRPYDGRWQG